jgi:hypothetical protein
LYGTNFPISGGSSTVLLVGPAYWRSAKHFCPSGESRISMYFSASALLGLPSGIETVGMMPIAPSLGKASATGTPLAAAAPTRSMYHGERMMSPRSSRATIWSAWV